MIRRLFVVHDRQQRAGIAKLPKMRVFVDFFPCEPSVPGEESIRFDVWRE